MAKAKVTVKCADCGAEITKEATKRNLTEAKSWESWVTRKTWQCKSCWSNEQHKKEIDRGLVIDVDIIANIGMLLGDHDRVVRLSFSGDTMQYKDAIKAQGYQWTHIEDTQRNLLV